MSSLVACFTCSLKLRLSFTAIFVTSRGNSPADLMGQSCVRHKPAVLGDQKSITRDDLSGTQRSVASVESHVVPTPPSAVGSQSVRLEIAQGQFNLLEENKVESSHSTLKSECKNSSVSGGEEVGYEFTSSGNQNVICSAKLDAGVDSSRDSQAPRDNTCAPVAPEATTTPGVEAAMPAFGMEEVCLSISTPSPKRKSRKLTSEELAVMNEFWECSSTSTRASSERGDQDGHRDDIWTSEIEYECDDCSSSEDDSDSSSEDGDDEDAANNSVLRQSDVLSVQQIEEFELHEVIGRGAYGYVQRATRGTKTYAAKILTWEDGNATRAIDFVSEMRNLKELSHKHIVRYVGAVIDMEIKRLVIYTEWMPSGSLKDQINECFQSGKTMSSNSVLNYAWQVAGGLEYLHSQNVAHLDLKPANIVRDQDGFVKLTDFGTSRKLIESGGFRDSSTIKKCGTICFMGPEVLSKKYQGTESDIWSFGCTILNLATGYLPWHETGIHDEMLLEKYITEDGGENIRKPSFQNIADASVCNMISLCLQRDPLKRPKIHCLYARLSLEFRGPNPIQSPGKSRSCTQLLKASQLEEERQKVVPLSPSNGKSIMRFGFRHLNRVMGGIGEN